MMTHATNDPAERSEPTDAVRVGSGDWFGDFERNAVAVAHREASARQEKAAKDRREWAKERGPIWQRYLAQAILCERRAREHRERATSILRLPNDRDEQRAGTEK